MSTYIHQDRSAVTEALGYLGLEDSAAGLRALHAAVIYACPSRIALESSTQHDLRWTVKLSTGELAVVKVHLLAVLDDLSLSVEVQEVDRKSAEVLYRDILAAAGSLAKSGHSSKVVAIPFPDTRYSGPDDDLPL